VRTQSSRTGAQPTAGLGLPRETRRLLPVVVPVMLAGALLVGAAAVVLARGHPSERTLGGLLVLVLATTLVEAFPVPIRGVPVGGTSLATVFVVGAAVMYGWAAAALVAFLAQALVEVGRRRPPIRVGYNTGVYALAAAAAGGAASVGSQELPMVVAAATAFYVVDLPLVVLVVSRWAREPFRSLLERAFASTATAFAIMASLSLMLVVLWERSWLLTAALLGPLVAFALYQRSAYRELEAMRLALTDPLTGLGNHRHFHERLDAELTAAKETGYPIALCLVDVDGFKSINDRFGHPIGDEVLVAVAQLLRQNGEAFRLGGDEFAVILPGRDEPGALAVGEAIRGRVASARYAHREALSVSIGIAAYPQHGVERSDLVRLADSALYWAKEHGKNRVHVYRPDVLELYELRRLEEPDLAVRLRAAATLARAVDAHDAYTGSHSHTVGELAARVAMRLGMDEEEIELVRLAGSLHDLGKLAIPEEILRKPGPLNEAERLVLERHPQIAFRMLDPLGVEPLGSWVLHHHERWDGGGYPDRLARDTIPLGARILFVADAFDAMTTDRVYRGRRTTDAAIAELERCAGTQFDPQVVRAFVATVRSRGAALAGA